MTTNFNIKEELPQIKEILNLLSNLPLDDEDLEDLTEFSNALNECIKKVKENRNEGNKEKPIVDKFQKEYDEKIAKLEKMMSIANELGFNTISDESLVSQYRYKKEGLKRKLETNQRVSKDDILNKLLSLKSHFQNEYNKLSASEEDEDSGNCLRILQCIHEYLERVRGANSASDVFDVETVERFLIEYKDELKTECCKRANEMEDSLYGEGK